MFCNCSYHYAPGGGRWIPLSRFGCYWIKTILGSKFWVLLTSLIKSDSGTDHRSKRVSQGFLQECFLRPKTYYQSWVAAVYLQVNVLWRYIWKDAALPNVAFIFTFSQQAAISSYASLESSTGEFTFKSKKRLGYLISAVDIFLDQSEQRRSISSIKRASNRMTHE